MPGLASQPSDTAKKENIRPPLGRPGSTGFTRCVQVAIARAAEEHKISPLSGLKTSCAEEKSAAIEDARKGAKELDEVEAVAVAPEKSKISPLAGLKTSYTDEENAAIEDARKLVEDKDKDQIVARPNLRRHDFMKLRDGVWLNDAIITAYLKTVRNRTIDELDVEQKRCHIVSTHFINTLRIGEFGAYNFKNVSSWQEASTDDDFDLFQFQSVLFPCHVNWDHWSLIIALPAEKKIVHCDSLKGDSQLHAGHIHRFLKDLHKERHGKLLHHEGAWERISSHKEGQCQRNRALFLSFVFAAGLLIVCG